jgi:uncharacterized membrane protein
VSRANRHEATRRCEVCGRTLPAHEVVPGVAVREPVAALIVAEHPGWTSDAFICRSDLGLYRTRFVQGLLADEKGELTALDHEVIESLRQHEILSADVDAEHDEKRTRGQRWADALATFGGSWTFLILFAVFLFLWVGANSLVFLWKPVDPYPFILLNLLLSCLAAIQAPIILMSQNRQEAKDRLRAQHDYQVNLKAELEIRHLHEKVDHLLSHQWERLVEIQEVQLELLAEIGRRK